MKTYNFVLLLAFATLCQASTIYKSVDGQGNVTFSDKPKSNTTLEKIELKDTSKVDESLSQHQLDSLEKENEAISERINKKQQALDNVDIKIKQDYAALQVAEKAMQQAYTNWQEAVVSLQRGGSDYEKKRALLLERAYEQAKNNFIKAQQDLVKSQSERNSLR